MIVLDANVLSEIFRPSPNARVLEWLEALTGEVARGLHGYRGRPVSAVIYAADVVVLG